MSPIDHHRARRRFSLGLAALPLAAARGGHAQEPPRGPARILVGYPPGGTIDGVARVLAEKMRDDLGQQVLVENRPGAGGQIAAAALRAAPADGSTWLLANDHQAAIIPLTMREPGYDPFRDFAPVGLAATFETSLGVHPRTGARSLAEFLAWARAHPRESNIGIPAPASIPEFLVQLFARSSGVPFTAVAYRGGAPLIQDLLGGQVPAALATPGEMLQHHQSGRVRVVAVAGAGRSPFLPEVPTFAESGVAGLDQGSFLAVFAPAGTPRAAIDRFNRAMGRALAQPDVVERMRPLTMTPATSSPEELAGRVRAFHAHWRGVIQASGFSPQ